MLKPLDLPLMDDVDSAVADATQLGRMFVRASAAWSRLGEEDPYYSVCSDPRLSASTSVTRAKSFTPAGRAATRNYLTSFEPAPARQLWLRNRQGYRLIVFDRYWHVARTSKNTTDANCFQGSLRYYSS